MCRSIGVKFCTMISSRPYFIMPVQNFRGPSPNNFMGQKQNLVRFQMTWKFGGEYIWNGWRYSKSVSIWFTAVPLAFSEKGRVNFGPPIAEISMWNHTHPHQLFWKTVFRSIEGAVLPIFTHTRERPSLTSAHPNGGRGLAYNFFQRRVQNWLKFQQCVPITLGVVGVAPWYFAIWHASRLGW